MRERGQKAMLWAGHHLDCFWSITVDVNRLPALVQSATEIRLERVIFIGPYFDR
jgi:hypothetical protein